MLNHQRPDDQSHALTEPSDASWPSLVSSAIPSDASWPSLVSSAIAQCYLCKVTENPASAQHMLDAAGSASFAAEGGSLSDVEQTLFESFIDDDYGGRLHLTTLRQNDEAGQVVGIVFWREVPDTEMREWINFDALSASISDLRGLVIDDNRDDDEHTAEKSGASRSSRHRRSLVPVREESLHWLYQATSSRHLLQRGGKSRATNTSVEALSREEVIDGLTHRWVKIELLAVQKSFWGHRYGSLLLATALQEAYQQKSNRAILHVAGGHSNVPAVKLYQRFGFVGVRAGDGGIFNKPDRDLFVLGNIGTALQSLYWSGCLPLPAPNTRNGNPVIEDGDVDAGGEISA